MGVLYTLIVFSSIFVHKQKQYDPKCLSNQTEILATNFANAKCFVNYTIIFGWCTEREPNEKKNINRRYEVGTWAYNTLCCKTLTRNI